MGLVGLGVYTFSKTNILYEWRMVASNFTTLSGIVLAVALAGNVIAVALAGNVIAVALGNTIER
mgnify:CR=1 FL=1